MTNHNGHISPAHGNVARAALVLGVAFVSACSGEFPVGDFGEREVLLDGAGSTATEGPRSSRVDGTVPAALPEPDAAAELAAGLGFGAITPVGDLDGDGNDDVIITASDLEHGYVFVRYGGPRLSTPESADTFVNAGARLVLPGEGFTIASVAAAGDVDGDGFDELVVLGSCDLSAFLVYGGPARLDGTLPLADVSARFAPPALSGEPSSLCLNAPALAAGDLDGDGRAELVLAVTPPFDETGFLFGHEEGLYLFYGRSERFAGEIPFAAADARLEAPTVLDRIMTGDVNGDGLGDLLTGNVYEGLALDGVIFVPGRADRWSGVVDLQTQATPLEGALMGQNYNASQLGDFDADGLSDVLLLDQSQLEMLPPEGPAFQLFYGAPGLFANGIDFGQANAQLFTMNSVTLLAGGDRDGDGDDEVLDNFSQLDGDLFISNVALVSGSRQRLSGAVTVPEAEVTAQTGNTLQLDVFALPVAADLDGDGASDLLTVTTLYDEENIPTTTRLNFHYGTLAPEAAPEIR